MSKCKIHSYGQGGERMSNGLKITLVILSILVIIAIIVFLIASVMFFTV
ncbi:hypothetical protein GLW08_03760 [Pontibacillus yanchengensis]|uniref:Uncharacterized protein n=2 Tax=Pontibacillus yanchengensis TaxID=462910 RepID=A0ACC7VCD7_9BACI|nr:hypothetical protein [Pontibacillus yanchengensis]MYL35181.1 hypothetical protein [Pontibacillus yanchengensis]MYL52452.1 hypothetical protein [Pontibacillus yanchengensis]